MKNRIAGVIPAIARVYGDPHDLPAQQIPIPPALGFREVAEAELVRIGRRSWPPDESANAIALLVEP